MQIRIEPVRSDEVELLSNISCKTFYDTFHLENTEEDMDLFLNQTFNENVLLTELSNKETFFFFAKFEDDVAGYLKLVVSDSNAELGGVSTLEVARIYTLKDKIGSGIGKALMEFSVSFARQQQKEIIYLGVWEHNQRAIGFYKKFGFEKFGEHVFMVGNDPQTDWLMKKQVEYGS